MSVREKRGNLVPAKLKHFTVIRGLWSQICIYVYIYVNILIPVTCGPHWLSSLTCALDTLRHAVIRSNN